MEGNIHFWYAILGVVLFGMGITMFILGARMREEVLKLGAISLAVMGFTLLTLSALNLNPRLAISLERLLS